MRSTVSRLFATVASATLLATVADLSGPVAAFAEAAQAPAGASASGQGDGTYVSEIVVTATKGAAASIQHVPITVQAMSGQQLQNMGALDFNDFYREIPGISIFDNGPGDKRYAVRGITSTGAGTVGVYLDDVVITAENAQDGGGQQFDVPLYDIERVEVLKGPQGTTFGSSSMAGTVRYITNKPNLTTFGEEASASVRSTGGAAFGPVVSGAVNIPVVEDKFAIRLAGIYENLPGWISSPFEKGVNTQKTSSFRAEAKWKITDKLSLSAMAMSEGTHMAGRSYVTKQDLAGNGIPDNQQAIVAQEPFPERAELYNGVLEYKPSYGTFTVSASEFYRYLEFNRDASLAAQAFLGLPLDGAGRSTLSQPKSRKVDSYEARFHSSWGGPVELLAGVYVQRELRRFQSIWQTDGPNGHPLANPTLLLDRTVNDQLTEKAAFAELTFHLTDKLQVITAARYYDIGIQELSDAIVGFGGGPGGGVGAPLHYSDNGVIGRFNVSYDFTRNLKLYAQVAQGYRSGGVNDQTAAEIAHVNIPAGYGSDTLINSELGAKTTWWNHRLIIDGALYHVDWSNIQLQNQATNGTASFPYTGNGGKAAVDGAEASIEVHPIKGLQLLASANYNYARLTTNEPIASNGMAGDLLPWTPRLNASISADYSWPLPYDGLTGQVGGSISYTSHTATDLNSTISDYRVLHGYDLVGLHAGVSKDHWTFSVAVENLFDDRTPVSYYETIEGLYPDGWVTNRPRTVSLTLSEKF